MFFERNQSSNVDLVSESENIERSDHNTGDIHFYDPAKICSAIEVGINAICTELTAGA